MKVEVDVEVALGIEFVGDSGGGIIPFEVLFGFVVEESGERLIYGAGELCFVRFLVVGDNPFTREGWVRDVLLSDIRGIADDDIESTLFAREDFDEGDVPNKE